VAIVPDGTRNAHCALSRIGMYETVGIGLGIVVGGIPVGVDVACVAGAVVGLDRVGSGADEEIGMILAGIH